MSDSASLVLTIGIHVIPPLPQPFDPQEWLTFDFPLKFHLQVKHISHKNKGN